MKRLTAVISALVLGFGAMPSYAVDGSAPELSNFQSTPKILDLRNGEGLVRISGRVSDESGVDHIHFNCEIRGAEYGRWLRVGVSFPASFKGGFAAAAFGATGGFDANNVASKTIEGSERDFTFDISVRIPNNWNSTDCNWRYFTVDRNGNRYSMSYLENLGQRLQVIDESGYLYENPEFRTPETPPNSPANSPVSQPADDNLKVSQILGVGPVTPPAPASTTQWRFRLLDSAGRPVSGAKAEGSVFPAAGFVSSVSESDDEGYSILTLLLGFSVEGIVTVSLSLASVSGSTSFDFGVAKKSEQAVPEFSVSQRTLASFSGSTTTLTSQQKAQVKAAVDANPSAEKFICTGIRFESAPMSENIVVRKRAKAACDYAKTLNPALSTWFQNKPTKSRSYAGKVLLTIKTPGN